MSDGSSPSESQGPDTGPRPGEVIASKYVVESILGVGGMGLVVAARHLQLNQRVAIKLLRKEAAFSGSSTSRFLREARAAAALASEHVARVVDIGTLESGLPFIVMEYLSGTDLAGLVAERGRIPYPEAVSLLLQACEAIAEAHSLGIIHRDLKPSNIFVTKRPDGTALVKVLDFGISKFQNPLGFAGEEATLTASGSVVGSPAYMSPEQIRSAKGTDARSDVWAMGVILHELLTGQNPFIGETIGDTLVKIASEPPPPVRDQAPETPLPLALVIARCLERDPALRIGSIAELARALEPFAGGDMAAFVARIVRVSTSPRPVSPTPPDGDPVAVAGTPPRQGATPTPAEIEGAWQHPPEPARTRRRVTWALWVSLAGVLGTAIVLALLRPQPLPSPPDGPAVRAAPELMPGQLPVLAPTATTLDAAPAGSEVGSPSAASGASETRDAPKPADRHRPRHAPPVSSPGVSSAPPASAASSKANRSLDDLLEGRQ